MSGQPAASATRNGTASARPQPTRRTQAGRHRWLPPQHGAWAMLLLPYIAAVCVTGPAWPQLPLLGAWLVGYLFSSYCLLYTSPSPRD